MNPNYSKVLILISLISAIVFVDCKHPLLNKQKPHCNDEKLLEIDAKLLKIMSVGKQGRKFPSSYGEARNYCRETHVYTKQVETFVNDCFVFDYANIAKLFIFGIKRMTRQMCSRMRQNKRLGSLIKVANCHNQIIADDPCLDEVTNKTSALIPLNIGKDKINYMCCYYVDLLQCEDRHFGQVPCSTYEGRQAWIDLIRSVNEDSLNFACGDYNEYTDLCKTIGRPSKKSKLKHKKHDKRFNSFMITALELFDSL